MATTENTRRLLVYWGPVGGYCLAIFLQSSFSTPEEMPTFYLSDKLLHMAAYAVMAILFYRALGPHPSKNTPVKRAVFSIAFTVLYGISDEVHQSFVPGRSPEWLDVAADAAGAIVGAVIARKIFAAPMLLQDTPSD